MDDWKIDPKLLMGQDTELAIDLIRAAINQSLARAREMAAEELKSAAGGLPLPPGFPFGGLGGA